MSLNVKRYNIYNLSGGSGTSDSVPDNFYLCPDNLKKAFPRTLCKESPVKGYCKIDGENKKLLEILFPHYKDSFLKSNKREIQTQDFKYTKQKSKSKKNVPDYWYEMEDTYNIVPDGNQALYRKNPELKMTQPYPTVFYESDTYKKKKPMEEIVKGRSISPWKRTDKGKYKISWDGT